MKKLICLLFVAIGLMSCNKAGEVGKTEQYTLEGNWGLISYERIETIEGVERPVITKFTRDPFNPRIDLGHSESDQKLVIVNLEKNEYIVNVYRWDGKEWVIEEDSRMIFEQDKFYDSDVPDFSGTFTLSSTSLTLSTTQKDVTWDNKNRTSSINRIYRKMSELTE